MASGSNRTACRKAVSADRCHILFLTNNFPPEVNAPASRTFEHCRAWVRAGHRVTVITCAPNFPQGRTFPGYRNVPWRAEVMDGIEVIRVWSYMTPNQGFLRRVLDHVSFMISAILASLFVRKVDVVIGTSPQFFTACAACAAAALRRRPWVFELRDLWPEAIRAVGAIRSDLLYRMIETVELFLYRNADLIVAVSHAFRGNLISRGIPGGKVRIITNGVDLARFRLAPKDEELLTRHGLQGKFVVGYIGTHGMSHALQTVVEACALLMDRPDARDIHILMIGDGAEKRALSAEARRRKLENISFIDTVPKADVVRYWTLLDASIVHLKDVDVHRTVIPSKIFESMAMGVAILHGAKGESEAIILDNGAGITFEQENPSDLAKKILELSHSPQSVRTMSSNGVSAATQYDRDTLAQRMLEEIVSLSERRARARLAATSG